MAEIVQDMQSINNTYDLIKILLATLQSLSDTTDTIAKGGFDKIKKQRDIEARTLESFLKHKDRGGEIEAVEVRNPEQAKKMLSLLRLSHVQYVANQTEGGMLFIYKDIDKDKFLAVAKEAELYARDMGHEMNPSEFMMKVATNQDYAKVEGLSWEEVAVFRREADKQSESFTFAVIEDKNKENSFTIVADKGKVLEHTLNDTLFVMGTERGQKYSKELAPFDRAREDFLNKSREKSKNEPAFIVDLDNPRSMVEIRNGSYRLHGMIMDKDGKNVMDTTTKYTKAISHDMYREMSNMGMKNPVLLTKSQLSFLIQGELPNGALELSPKYRNPKQFKELSDILKDKYEEKELKAPLMEPEMEGKSSLEAFKEQAVEMTIYQNLPITTLNKIKDLNIDGVCVYQNGNVREVACPKEALPQVGKVLREDLAKDAEPLETWLTMQKYKGRGERSNNKDETYYIVDASFPDCCLEISPQDRTYKNEEINIAITAEHGKSLDENTLKYVANMADPIVLTKDEYELMTGTGELEQQVVESHYVNPLETKVIQDEFSKIEIERKEVDFLLELDASERKNEDITPSQQYVLDQHEQRDLSAQKVEKIHQEKFRAKSKNKERKSQDIDR